MSIIVGKARSFRSSKSQGVAQDSSFQARDHEKFVANTPPPLAYRGLQTGPSSTLEYEQAQALPIDGSNKLLRSLSPFVIQVEPPLVFGDSPPAQDGNARGLGVYAAAAKGRDNTVRSSQVNSTNNTCLGSMGQGNDAVEEVPLNNPDPFSNRSGDGSVVANSEGGTTSRLGYPSITDLKVALDVAVQLSAIYNTPPLVLLINPNTVGINYTRIQQFSDRSRYGYIYQAWGEEQPKLSITAKCGAFLSGGRGLQFASKRDSAAWQNLMSAFKFYQNNGYIHDTIGESNAHHFVGGLSIHYDSWVYYGNMESFTYTYDESNQHGGVEFNIEFVVTSMIDTSKTSNAVSPMFSPNLNGNNPKYAQRGSRRGRAGNLSVGIHEDGQGFNVDDRLFGSGGAPQPWTPTTAQGQAFMTSGDPDFRAQDEQPSGGTTVITSGGGFTFPETEGRVAVTISQKPEPFQVR